MGELRQKFEETEFFKRTLLDVAKPYVSFRDGEYKTDQDSLFSIAVRLSSGWDVFKEQQSKIEQLEKKLKAVEEIMNDYYTGSFEESAEMAGLISLALSGECDE